MGKSVLEPQIMEEIQLYISHFIEPNHNQPINMFQSLSAATGNIISQFLFHRRFDYNDTENNKIANAVGRAAQLTTKYGLVSIIPMHKYLFRSLHAEVKENSEFIKTHFKSILDEQIRHLDPDHPQGLMDNFLINTRTKEAQANYCLAGESSEMCSLVNFNSEPIPNGAKTYLIFLIVTDTYKLPLQFISHYRP